MVREHVEKTMKKAINAFAEKEQADPTSIAFFIHTKPNEAEPLSPKYFYSVDGETVKGEDGKLIDLRFTQDILGKKFDLVGTEALAKQFLEKYFERISGQFEVSPKSLYISISLDPQWTNKLRFMLLNGNEVLKSSDNNEKEEQDCSPEEWKDYLEEKACYSEEEWRERVKKSYSLEEIFGE